MKVLGYHEFSHVGGAGGSRNDNFLELSDESSLSNLLFDEFKLDLIVEIYKWTLCMIAAVIVFNSEDIFSNYIIYNEISKK